MNLFKFTLICSLLCFFMLQFQSCKKEDPVVDPCADITCLNGGTCVAIVRLRGFLLFEDWYGQNFNIKSTYKIACKLVPCDAHHDVPHRLYALERHHGMELRNTTHFYVHIWTPFYANVSRYPGNDSKWRYDYSVARPRCPALHQWCRAVTKPSNIRVSRSRENEVQWDYCNLDRADS